VVQYNRNSRKFDMIKKQEDLSIPNDFYKCILPRLQESLNNSKYCDTKSTELSAWWYAAWTAYIFIIFSGGLMFLVHMELIYLFEVLVVITLILSTIPYLFLKTIKNNRCLSVHEYMIKRQY
jgi:hypothetical protein